MNYQKLAEMILEEVGTEKNVFDAFHCMTRLRFVLKDQKKANIEKLKQLDGVMEVRFLGDQLQVIIGNDVQKVWNEMKDRLPKGEGKISKTETKQGLGGRLMELISGIFGPILPAITGAGLMKGILPLLVLLGWVSETSDTYQILSLIGDAAFYFLPILIAVSASRRFKVNEIYGVTVAAAMLYPTIMNGEGVFNFLGFIPIPATSYASTVIPIILTIWALGYVHKFVVKIMPQAVTIVFTPLVTFVIIIPLALALFGPLGNYVGQGVVFVTSFLKDYVPWLYGAVMTALAPLAVMTGMTFAFWPGMFLELEKFGFESGFLVLSIFSNVAMAGATLGAYFRLKKKENRTLTLAAFLSAVFGITEPALYGVALKYKKPLYANMAAAGIVGAIMMGMKVRMYGFSAPNLFSLSLLIPPNGNDLQNLYVGIFGVVAVFILALVFSLLLGVDEDVETEQQEEKEEKKESTKKRKKGTLSIEAPVEGTVFPLSKSSDAVFRDGNVGKGVLFLPNEQTNTIYAPFDGKVTAIMDATKHAIGLKSDDGVELLIHIGVDTVEMKGDGFCYLVEMDEKIEKGQPLMHFDLEKIRAAELSSEILMIVTNTADYFEIVVQKPEGDVKPQEEILYVLS